MYTDKGWQSDNVFYHFNTEDDYNQNDDNFGCFNLIFVLICIIIASIIIDCCEGTYM